MLGLVLTLAVIAMQASIYWLALAAGWVFSLVAAHLLAFNAPRGLREQIEANGVRMDGTVSRRRVAIENRGLRILRGNMAFVLFLIVLFSVIVFGLVNLFVFPFDVGIQAIGDAVIEQRSAGETQDIAKLRLEHWHQGAEVAGDYPAYKSWLKEFFPFLIVGAVIWLLVAALTVKSFYFYLLRQLRSEVTHRAEEYFLRDLGREQQVQYETESACEPAHQPAAAR